MRGLIGLLIFLMILLIGNIVFYAASEDYRFFLKKIKYQEDPVYTTTDQVSDNLLVDPGDTLGAQDTTEEQSNSLTFLDTLTGTNEDGTTQVLPDISEIEQAFVSAFDSFDLKKLETHTNIFGITTEYPDPYHEYYSAGVSVYVLSTKSYSQVQDIFEVLAFELPYSLNVVNNFGQQSFYINLDSGYTDDFVRIVLEYENKAFGLKIRKDRYNESKKILDQL